MRRTLCVVLFLVSFVVGVFIAPGCGLVSDATRPAAPSLEEFGVNGAAPTVTKRSTLETVSEVTGTAGAVATATGTPWGVAAGGALSLIAGALAFFAQRRAGAAHDRLDVAGVPAAATARKAASDAAGHAQGDGDPAARP